MKKTHKNVLGTIGLAAVAAITAYAAILPSPDAAAADPAVTSHTDTLKIRVVGDVPSAYFSAPAHGSTIMDPSTQLEITHENLNTAVISLSHNRDGAVLNITNFETLNIDYMPGDTYVPVDWDYYGYGAFTFTLNGLGFDGAPVSDTITIYYAPIDVEVTENDGGSVDVEVDYDKDSGVVDHVDVEVYGPDGETKVYGETVGPDGAVEIPFEDFTESGEYTIVVNVYDGDGEIIYTEEHKYYHEHIVVPNTGSFFRNLNIAQEDYLITGVIVFLVLSVVAFGVVAKGRQDTKNKKRRH